MENDILITIDLLSPVDPTHPYNVYPVCPLLSIYVEVASASNRYEITTDSSIL